MKVRDLFEARKPLSDAEVKDIAKRAITANKEQFQTKLTKKLQGLMKRGYFKLEAWMHDNLDEELGSYIAKSVYGDVEDKKRAAGKSSKTDPFYDAWFDNPDLADFAIKQVAEPVLKKLDIKLQMVSGPDDPNYVKPSWSKV